MKQGIFQIGKHESLQILKSDTDLINANTNKQDKEDNTYIEKINIITSIKPFKVAENVYYFNK
jgi:hypothetical protein